MYMLYAPNIISVDYSEACSVISQSKIKSNKKVFLLCWKGGKTFDFCTAHDMSAGHMLIYYCSYMSLYGFFIILPYLVLTINNKYFL